MDTPGRLLRLLTLLSIFWLTDTLGSSCRFYAESIRHAWKADYAALIRPTK